jgi:hypothetical protein
MTGINASKIIQNLQFLNNFASMSADVCCQSRQRALRWLRAVEHRDFETRKEKKPILVFCRFFFFSEIGSGAYGHHPLIGGRDSILESYAPRQLRPGFQEGGYYGGAAGI